MHPLPSLDTYRPLIDSEDADWFHANELDVKDECPAKTHRRWAEQAAWLTILKAFDEYPTLEELAFDVDESDADRYVFVQTRHVGDEALNGLGEDPESLDEQLQSYINDMGRNDFVSFHARLAQTGARRDSLDEDGEEVLGSEWVAHRRQALLERQLSTGSSPSGSKPRV